RQAAPAPAQRPEGGPPRLERTAAVLLLGLVCLLAGTALVCGRRDADWLSGPAAHPPRASLVEGSERLLPMLAEGRKLPQEQTLAVASPERQLPVVGVGAGSAEGFARGSCAVFGCGIEFQPGRACQCDPDCIANKNCCADYVDSCCFDYACPKRTKKEVAALMQHASRRPASDAPRKPSLIASLAFPTATSMRTTSTSTTRTATATSTTTSAQLSTTSTASTTTATDARTAGAAPRGAAAEPAGPAAPAAPAEKSSWPPPEFAWSCASYGCVGYNPLAVCQCNPGCREHGTCCYDFERSCGLQERVLALAEGQPVQTTRLPPELDDSLCGDCIGDTAPTNEDAVTVYAASCGSPRNRCCGACGMWNNMDHRIPGCQVVHGYLVVPSDPLVGMEAITGGTAPHYDFLWREAADRAGRAEGYVLLVNPFSFFNPCRGPSTRCTSSSSG
ncbi:unnamed protein product, partial [Prorocentrum cordatum]